MCGATFLENAQNLIAVVYQNGGKIIWAAEMCLPIGRINYNS